MAGSERSCCVPSCGKTRKNDTVLHSFPNPEQDMNRYLAWVQAIGSHISSLEPQYVYKQRRVCHAHFETKYLTWTRRLSPDAVPTLSLYGSEIASVPSMDIISRNQNAVMNAVIPSTSKGMLEVCIDSLESAINAIHGGADELEVCSSLHEGGLTPTAGLVNEIIEMVKNLSSKRPMYKTCKKCNCTNLIEDPNFRRPKVNVMLRCRGSNFCYTQEEIDTMISDLKIFKSMGVDRFVFGALTNRQEVDLSTCKRFIEEAGPVPMTFHRAYDFCKNPYMSFEKIIELGFNRLLTSGQEATVDDVKAIKLIEKLHSRCGDVIEIMPGSGVNEKNVKICLEIGCKIVHSSCKSLRKLESYDKDLGMGSSHVYVTDENIVRSLKDVINSVER